MKSTPTALLYLQCMSGRVPPKTVSPVIEAINKRIQNLEISGYRLAKLTGLPLRTVQRFLANQGSPTLSTVEAIAGAVGMKLKPEISK